MNRYVNLFLTLALLASASVLASDTREPDTRDIIYQARVDGMVSIAEIDAIEATCYPQREFGLDAYYQCVWEQLSQLEILTEKPDISGLSDRHQYEIERACGIDMRMYGKVVYYRCISRQMAELIKFSGKPDLSGVTEFERSSIEQSCGIDKRLWGPANYYSCIRDRLSELKVLADKPDLSKLGEEERALMTRRCDIQKRLYGPARYYQCVLMVQAEEKERAARFE